MEGAGRGAHHLLVLHRGWHRCLGNAGVPQASMTWAVLAPPGNLSVMQHLGHTQMNRYFNKAPWESCAC